MYDELKVGKNLCAFEFKVGKKLCAYELMWMLDLARSLFYPLVWYVMLSLNQLLMEPFTIFSIMVRSKAGTSLLMAY